MELGGGCPGRDTSTWTPDDIFEVPCPACGTLIEFFKDDRRRPCPTCGLSLANPRLSAACATWCSAAERCAQARGESLNR
jgi:endogenous inhibitor of DNA gyrase (YacG/DUF329 family)